MTRRQIVSHGDTDSLHPGCPLYRMMCYRIRFTTVPQVSSNPNRKSGGAKRSPTADHRMRDHRSQPHTHTGQLSGLVSY